MYHGEGVLKNIFESGELREEVVCSILEHTTQHGGIEGNTQVGEDFSGLLSGLLPHARTPALTLQTILTRLSKWSESGRVLTRQTIFPMWERWSGLVRGLRDTLIIRLRTLMLPCWLQQRVSVVARCRGLEDEE